MSICGPQFEAVKARRPEIEAWIDGCVSTHEIAQRLGIKRGSLSAYLAVMGVRCRPSQVVKKARKHPDLKSLIFQEGETSFLAAVEARACAIGVEKRNAQRAAMRDKAERRAAAVRGAADAVTQGTGRNQALRAARAAGATLEALGQRFGITRERVRQICAKPNDGRTGHRRRGDFEAIAQAYASGLSIPAVCKQFRCGPLTVRAALAQSNIRVRRPGRQAKTTQVTADYEAAWLRHAEFLSASAA